LAGAVAAAAGFGAVAAAAGFGAEAVAAGFGAVAAVFGAAAASFFSSVIIALTPSYMSCTRSTSPLPSLLLFEISNTPSSVSECSPWIPLI
jgi:hypothetical protein